MMCTSLCVHLPPSLGVTYTILFALSFYLMPPPLLFPLCRQQLIEHEEAAEVAGGLVAEVLDIAVGVLFQHHLDRTVIPHTVGVAKKTLLQMVEVRVCVRVCVLRYMCVCVVFMCTCMCVTYMWCCVHTFAPDCGTGGQVTVITQQFLTLTHGHKSTPFFQWQPLCFCQ